LQPNFLVGIDGGGTHCRVRLIDGIGRLLAECHGGPANIFSDADGAITTALTLVEQAFQQAGLPPAAQASAWVGFGFAGANVQRARQRAERWPMPFAARRIASDVEIACLGAHGGQPGAVLIVGTGSQATSYDGHSFRSCGGWGFALGDQGSGAILGRHALRLALLAHEGIVPVSPLTQSLLADFGHSPETLLVWTQSARAHDWAAFSPRIFTYAAEGDVNGVKLVEMLAREIDLLLASLVNAGSSRIALMGGIAQPILPWLNNRWNAYIVSPVADALDGALRLAAAASACPTPAAAAQPAQPLPSPQG